MLSWLEKHSAISWTISLLIAIFIFYISSMTFEGVSSAGSSINSIIYHLLIFFIFALFLSISVMQGKAPKLIFIVIVISILYGLSDEMHQFFVPGRTLSLRDLLLDATGIIFAAAFYVISIYYRNHKIS